MFNFLRQLFGTVARGLWWGARQALGLACDLVEAPFVAWWRHVCPPPAEREESTADVLREVAGLITGQAEGAERRAETERPVPKPASAALVKRRMERAMAYTAALMAGDRLPSLDHVGAELAYELGRLRTPDDAEPMHRELMQALGMDADGWVRPRREMLAPGPDHDHDEEPKLRYA